MRLMCFLKREVKQLDKLKLMLSENKNSIVIVMVFAMISSMMCVQSKGISQLKIENESLKSQVGELGIDLDDLREVNEGLEFEIIDLKSELNDTQIKLETSIKNSKVDIGAIYTNKEIDLLASTVWSESGNENFESQIWTARVLMNRVNSKYFPNTVNGVVYQGNGRQFNGVLRDNFGYKTKESYHAVLMAHYADFITDDIVYFANVELSSDSKFINNVIIPNTVKITGGHNYAYDDRIRDNLNK